jgi:hypothetical protein
MKITEADSEQIFKLAKDPKNKLSNVAIGEQFGISEALVRYHVRKQEEKLALASLSQEVLSKPIDALSLNCRQQAANILAELQQSITVAKTSGVSPEKLSGLYSVWLRSLELCADLLGQRSPPPVSQGGSIISIQISTPTIPEKRRIVDVTARPTENGLTINTSSEPVEPHDNYKNEVINKESAPVVEPITAPVTEPGADNGKLDAAGPCTCPSNGGKIYPEYRGVRCVDCGGVVR